MNEFDQAIMGLSQGDEYDQAVSAQLPDAVPARFGYLVGSERDPEAYAEARRVAASTGVPVDTVLAQPQEMKRQAAMGSIDFDTLAATAPATAALLADVQKASVAHDNVGSLQSVEQTINALAGRRDSKAFAPLRQAPQAAPELGPLDRALGAVGDATSTGLGFAGGTLSAIAAAIPKFNEGAWGVLRAGGDVLPSAVGQPIADFASRMGGAARGMGDAMMPKADGLLGSAWYSGMQSFGLNMLQLPLAFLPGGQAPLAASIAGQVAPRLSPVLWSMGAVTGGEAYGKARDKGVGVLPSLAFGASQGVIEAGTEMIGMPALFSLLKPGQFAAKAAEYLLKEQGGEQLATHMQDLNEWAVLNPDKPFSDYLHERPAAAVQTALSVLFAGAAQAGTVRGVGHVLYKARDEAEKVQASEQQAQLLTQLARIAQADKLLAREPATFEAFVQQAAEDGPVENVYIDGNVLMQSGLMPDLAQVSPAIAAQAAEAAKAGGLVAIPVGEYTARIAPTEQGLALLDHLKTDPEGFSRAEAQVYLQTQGEQLQQDIIKSLTDSVQAERTLADVATVRGTLRDELVAAGRRPDVADAESAVLGAYYATRAQDLGVTASEMFAQRMGASVSEGEQRILRDVGTLLTWHGLKGDLADQLAEWHNLPFEEKRAHHERTAESFERYLFEGKAPSLELTGYFQRFRSWMVGVYRSIKDFLDRNPQAGQLSEDVRAVFDRMLATDDQIALAEQGRSLVPLFENADQAGMTPEEFAAYQANGQQATADAVEELQARGLRDMQWLRGARGRELKRLQAEAAGLRAEQETQARLEVFSDPLYRAWRFLTGKLTDEDKLPEPVKTSGGQTLNPEVDSLLVAIAKLGGITRESAGQHLGVHADNFKHLSGVFGAPVFRKTGGLSADAMSERLAELGYLLPDEDGKIDLRDLEGKIDSELRGHPEYSVARDLSGLGQAEPRAGEGVDVAALGAARLDAGELRLMGLPAEVIQTLKARRMVAKNGLPPDLVAEQFGFTSGDELVRKL